jgi:hypothetical protein
VPRGLRRLHNDELQNLYASPNIIRVIKSRRMRLEKAVARKERCEMHTKFRPKILKGRENSEDLDGDKRKILEWILGK